MARSQGVQEVPVNRWSTFLHKQGRTKATIETVTGCRLQPAGCKFYWFVFPGYRLAACRAKRSEEGSKRGDSPSVLGEGNRPDQLNLT